MAEENPPANGVRCPSRLMREMRPVGPLWYGPTGGSACAHCSGVVKPVPAVPASATYRGPSGRRVRPRGYSRPVAKTETVPFPTRLEEVAASVGAGLESHPATTTAAAMGTNERMLWVIRPPMIDRSE